MSVALGPDQCMLASQLTSIPPACLWCRFACLLQVLQDFLTYMSGDQGPGPDAAVHNLLVMGAVRCLGRFWGEAPEAAGEQAASLLPFMMKVSGAGLVQGGG